MRVDLAVDLVAESSIGCFLFLRALFRKHQGPARARALYGQVRLRARGGARNGPAGVTPAGHATPRREPQLPNRTSAPPFRG